MKEIIRLLAKDGKDFQSFGFFDGIVHVNYYEKRILKSVNVKDNSELNIRTVNTIDSFIRKLLISL